MRKQNAPKPRTRTKDVYTEEQRMQAVTAMFAVDPEHPEGIEALEAARKVLNANVATATLDRWKHKYGERVLAASKDLTPVPKADSEIVNGTLQKLVGNFSKFLVSASERMADKTVIENANLRDLMVSTGIAIDKLRLLTDISPELSAVTKEYAQQCQRLRLDPVVILQDYMITLEIEYGPQPTAAAIDVHAAAR